MKVFLINLDKNTDRLAYMTSRLNELHIPFERIPAVYGAMLKKDELHKSFAAFRSFLCEGRRVTKGEIGCALSHCEVYRRIIDENLPCALVLEDDVALGDELPRVLHDVEQFCKADTPQAVLLSAHGIEEPRRKQSGIERIGSGMCTDAYVITNAGARLVLHSNFPMVAVADRWIRWKKRFGLELYRAWPMTAWQDKTRFPDSDVSNHPQRRRGLRLFVHRIFRAVELSVDWGLFKMTGK